MNCRLGRETHMKCGRMKLQDASLCALDASDYEVDQEDE